jgi:hypothetical protein
MEVLNPVHIWTKYPTVQVFINFDFSKKSIYNLSSNLAHRPADSPIIVLTLLINQHESTENLSIIILSDIPQMFTRAKGSLAASVHEVGTVQVRVLIGCVFVEIVIESKTCHICRAVLLTI